MSKSKRTKVISEPVRQPLFNLSLTGGHLGVVAKALRSVNMAHDIIDPVLKEIGRQVEIQQGEMQKQTQAANANPPPKKAARGNGHAAAH